MTDSPNILSPDVVDQAYQRIKLQVCRTPLLSSSLLNNWLGHTVLFKAENLQRTGAFKLRGVLNALLQLKEMGQLPKTVVAYSSGNHAQAVSMVASMMGVKPIIIMPKFVAEVKQQAATAYGAELILTETRQEAEQACIEHEKQGSFFLSPSAHDYVIAGQSTVLYETLLDDNTPPPDAVFAPCGGGGLLAGTWLATKALKVPTKVFGVEPLIANDAARSYRSGEIYSFDETPMTIADGARTLHLTPLCFDYVKQVDGFYEVEEKDIIYWAQWIQHLLKTSVEPTGALPMAGAIQWLKEQKTKKRIVVILSGGNMDQTTHRKIWKKDCLHHTPSL